VVPRRVYFISSFEIDEPVYEVFRASEILGPDGFHFYVTGRYQKRKIVPENFPYITFLGFVPEVDFYKHLFCSEIVVDLTERDNCLVCGAYEALEANKPLVLSRKKALEEYFTGGTIFTENRATEIAAAIRLAYTEKLKLIASSQQWVSQERKNIKTRMVDLKSILERI
jgi:glycosyltransferase involved in cell wall biosynthesis